MKCALRQWQMHFVLLAVALAFYSESFRASCCTRALPDRP